MKYQDGINILRLSKEVCLIVGVTLISGMAINFFRQDGVHIIPDTFRSARFHRIDVHRAKLKFDAGALFIDARSADEYREKHVKDALNLPLTLFDFVYRMKLERLDRQKELVVYGRSISTLYGEEVAVRLLSKGHTNVVVMEEDFDDWSKRDFPSEP